MVSQQRQSTNWSTKYDQARDCKQRQTHRKQVHLCISWKAEEETGSNNFFALFSAPALRLAHPRVTGLPFRHDTVDRSTWYYTCFFDTR